jgi:hypothetical protein
MENLKDENMVIPLDIIERRIFIIRGRKVMTDYDLAELYRVPTKRLNEAVKRNKERFPDDFMFQLSVEEAKIFHSRSQIATLKQGENIKYMPYAFTEQGVAMLSSVLRSDRAVAVNIAIIRTFVRLRQLLASNKELAEKVMEMEKNYDKKFKIVFEVLKQLMGPPPEEDDKPLMGFRKE